MIDEKISFSFKPHKVPVQTNNLHYFISPATLSQLLTEAQFLLFSHLPLPLPSCLLLPLDFCFSHSIHPFLTCHSLCHLTSLPCFDHSSSVPACHSQRAATCCRALPQRAWGASSRLSLLNQQPIHNCFSCFTSFWTPPAFNIEQNKLQREWKLIVDFLEGVLQDTWSSSSVCMCAWVCACMRRRWHSCVLVGQFGNISEVIQQFKNSFGQFVCPCSIMLLCWWAHDTDQSRIQD